MVRANKRPRARSVDPHCRGRRPGQFLALMTGVMLVVGLAMLLQLAPASAAQGYPGKLVEDTPAAIGPLLSGLRDSLQASEPSTHTVWLPYVAKDSRLPEGLFGAQIYGNDLASVERMSDVGVAWVRFPCLGAR